MLMLVAAYMINSAVDKGFIVGIQRVFSSMIKLTEYFRGEFELRLDQPSSISRVAATLHNLYYQVSKHLQRA